MDSSFEREFLMNLALSPYKVACCLYSSAAKVIEENGLPVPTRGGVDHRGSNDACCDSLTVWWDSTTRSDQVVFDPCSDTRSREFVISYSGKACTEGAGIDDPCGEAIPHCEPSDGECFDSPEFKLGDGKCSDGERPTVPQETAAVWAIRYLLETDALEEAGCCLQECAGLRCEFNGYQSSTGLTSGGCFFVELRVIVEW